MSRSNNRGRGRVHPGPAAATVEDPPARYQDPQDPPGRGREEQPGPASQDRGHQGRHHVTAGYAMPRPVLLAEHAHTAMSEASCSRCRYGVRPGQRVARLITGEWVHAWCTGADPAHR